VGKRIKEQGITQIGGRGYRSAFNYLNKHKICHSVKLGNANI